MQESRRDEFSRPIKQRLLEASSGYCSNPDCRVHTVAGKAETGERNTIGKAAHITAAASGGPRYEDVLTKVERSSFDNGIWLCSNCATKIDTDPDAYPVALLNDWKRSSMVFANEQLGKPASVALVKSDHMQCKMCREPIKQGARVCKHCSTRIEYGMPPEYIELLMLGVLMTSAVAAYSTTNAVMKTADWKLLEDAPQIATVGAVVFLLVFIGLILLAKQHVSPKFAERVSFRRRT